MEDRAGRRRVGPRIEATGRSGAGGRSHLERTRTMLDHKKNQYRLAKAVSLARQRPELNALKNVMLAMLGAWLAYFLVINWFVTSLNHITVPFVELPLGVFLVIQGAVVIFFVACYLMTKMSDIFRS
jgi:putative solute:sodium symporter small subunit